MLLRQGDSPSLTGWAGGDENSPPEFGLKPLRFSTISGPLGASFAPSTNGIFPVWFIWMLNKILVYVSGIQNTQQLPSSLPFFFPSSFLLQIYIKHSQFCGDGTKYYQKNPDPNYELSCQAIDGYLDTNSRYFFKFYFIFNWRIFTLQYCDTTDLHTYAQLTLTCPFTHFVCGRGAWPSSSWLR